VFATVLRMCRDAGLIRLGLVFLDGTKVKANASLEANRSAATIDEQVRRMLAEAESTDQREDRRFGPEGGERLPPALSRREDRLARLCACKARLEREAEAVAARQPAKIDARAAAEQTSGKRRHGRKPKPAAGSVDPERVANPTNPDSSIMKTRRGWVQGYNAQLVVTPQQIIPASAVTTEANDVRQLQPMRGGAQAMVELLFGEDARLAAAAADAGFWSDKNAASASRRNARCSSPRARTASSGPSCGRRPRHGGGCRKGCRRVSACSAR
jgi:hypothetical protein